MNNQQFVNMNAINVDAVSLSALVCVTCLSAGRKLFPLNSFSFLSHKIFKDIGLRPNSPESVCWECKALIEKYTQFYNRAQTARIYYYTIKKSSSAFRVEKLSTLSVTAKNDFDAVYVGETDIDYENEINTFGIGSRNEFKMETNDEGSDTESELLTEVDKAEAGAMQHHKRIKKEVDYDETIQPQAMKRFTVTAGPLPKPGDQQKTIPQRFTMLPTTSSRLIKATKAPNKIVFFTVPKIVSLESLGSRKDFARVVDKRFGSEDIAEFSANIGKPTVVKVIEPTVPKPGTELRYEEFETIRITDKELKAYQDELRTRRKYIGSSFKCEDCIVFFTCGENLQKHMEEVHGLNKGDHVCPICKRRFTNLTKLYSHNQDHYKLYKCSDCTFRTHCMSRALGHWRTTHDTEEVECRRCDVKLPPGELKKHYVAAHMETVECDTCTKRFKTKYLLTQHIKSRHSQQKSTKAQCNICKRRYLQSFLHIHMKRAHEQEKKDKNTYCADCDVSFKSEINYKLHLRNNQRHIKPDYLKYECDYCKKRFLIKSVLSYHIEDCHLKVARYRCKIEGCNAVFCSQRANKKHFTRNHSGRSININKYICDICGKRFTIKKSLVEHANFHSGERPFKCDKCDATFMYSSALFTHNKLVHLKIKRPCDLKKKTG